MFAEWNQLPEALQIALSHEALHRAAATIAAQAEVLATEMECGNLADRGGADALRLFAAVVRVNGQDELARLRGFDPVRGDFRQSTAGKYLILAGSISGA